MDKYSLKLFGILLFLTIMLFLASCGPNSSGSEEYGPFFVTANVSHNTPTAGIINVYVQVYMNGVTPVDDAIVTLDGITVPWDGLANSGIYIINDSVAFGPYVPGDTLELIAESADGKYIVIGSAQMPEQLNILSPTAVGGPYNANADIIVTWNEIIPKPDHMVICIDMDHTSDGYTYYDTLNLDATSYTLAAGTLKTGLTGVTICITTRNTDDSLGKDADVGSVFEVYNATFTEPFDTQ